MQVTLIDYTQNAVDKLLYTKATRLTLGRQTRDEIAYMDDARKLVALKMMAKTVPSSWEFVNYTFEIIGVTRAFTHQFVRTRTGSYAQQTMRVLDMEDWGYEAGPTVKDSEEYHLQMDSIKRAYRKLLADGASIEDARGILPTNIHTNIIAQFSLRAIADLWRSRSGGRTQEEYREVLDAMVDRVYEVHTWAVDFIQPMLYEPIIDMERFIRQMQESGNISKEEGQILFKNMDLIRKNTK